MTHRSNEQAFFQPYEEIGALRRRARQVLGVAEEAGAEEIKLAFHRLARTRHPDAGGDLGAFTRIVNAYLVLTKPDPRGFPLGSPGGEPLDVPQSDEDYLKWWLGRFGP